MQSFLHTILLGGKFIKSQKLYTSTWLNLNYGTSSDKKCEGHRDGGIYQNL